MAVAPFPASPERERFVEDLLGYMTLEEKAGQLALTPFVGNDPGFHDQLRRGLVGGVIGPLAPGEVQQIQRIATEETRLGIPLFIASDIGQGVRTRIAAPLSAASSWDPAAIEEAERLVAEEAAAAGINWALASSALDTDAAEDDSARIPMVESPWLAGRLLAARVRGHQAVDEAGRRQVLACLDPWAAITNVRGQAQRDEREQAILELIASTRPGSIAPEAKARFGDNGRHRPQDSIALLRRPGLYEGILLSEWASLAERAGHPPAASGFVGLSVERLVAAVRSRTITNIELDNVVRRVIGAKYDLGLFRPDFSQGAIATEGKRSVREPALDLARKSIVLLRNGQGLLPLSIDSGEVLIVGNAARDRSLPLDGASGAASNVIEGLEELGIACKFVPGLALRQEGSAIDRMIDADRMAIGMAGEAARRSRTVICVLGENCGAPGDPLGEAHRTLIETLRAANPRLILLTLGRYPVDPDIGGGPLPCVLHAGLLGTQSGKAIAEVLAGDHDPSGRLPFVLRTAEGVQRLPFGHGLSYADFALTDVAVEMGVDRVLASARLSNPGERGGSELVQLYVRRLDPAHPEAQPALRGFTRVHLRPGTREMIAFELGAAHLGVLDASGRNVVEPGAFEISIGFNAERVQRAEIYVPQTIAEAMTTGHSDRGQLGSLTAPRRA